MTDQIRHKYHADCLIVAPGDWPERIRGQLQRRFGSCGGGQEMMDCRDIYEAAAQILEAQGQGRGVLVYVLVDSMPEAEMQFFSCWSENARVRTVALSVARRQGKLALALARGADEAMILNGRKSAQAFTLSPPVAEAPPQVAAIEGVKPAAWVEDEVIDRKETENIVDSVLEDNEPAPSVCQEVAQSEPVIPEETPKAQAVEPVLTEDELNALLS